MATGSITSPCRAPLSLFPGLLRDRKEAKAAGHKSYFGGISCLKGHLSPRRVFDGKCCECIDQSKARERAVYLKGLERGRAPERARKEAEAEAREKLKEEQRAAKRDETARAREERARQRSNEKRKATLAERKRSLPMENEVQQDVRKVGTQHMAPW